MITIIVNNFTCIETNNKKKGERKKDQFTEFRVGKESKNHDESLDHFKLCILI